MLLNPALTHCGAATNTNTPTCTTEETSLRLSLMLKSLQRCLTVIVTETDEALAIRGLAPIAERVQREGIGALLEVNPIAAGLKLRAILGSDDLRSLVNGEVLALLADGPDLARNAREVYAAVTSVGKFSAEDPAVLFRPGILDFAALAAKIGRIGSFYAGYGPQDPGAFAAFLAGCAPGTRGLRWDELAPRPLGTGTCESAFDALVSGWRARLLQDEAAHHSRIDDPIGTTLHALVATSLLTGATRTAYDDALARYRTGRPPSFTPATFADVRIGYFGEASDAAAAAADQLGFADAKTRKALALGPASWRQILALSPAEPGLARAQAFGDGHVSAAGWPDLHPVQALRNIGCERVIYVTRSGEDSAFGRGMARLLGATEPEMQAIYALDDPASAFSTALRNASGVWCTDWDSFKDAEIAAMAAEAYAAPLETSDAFFATGADGMPAYERRVAATGRRGCTAGAAP